MNLGYIRIRTTHSNYIVERYEGKKYLFFDNWVEVQRFPATKDGNFLANQLARKITGNYDYMIV